MNATQVHHAATTRHVAKLLLTLGVIAAVPGCGLHPEVSGTLSVMLRGVTMDGRQVSAT